MKTMLYYVENNETLYIAMLLVFNHTQDNNIYYYILLYIMLHTFKQIYLHTAFVLQKRFSDYKNW